MTTESTYHALLVGIDRYPPRYNADLGGCVSDIEALESLLLDPLGVCIPAERVRIPRLAAPVAGQPATARFGATMATLALSLDSPPACVYKSTISYGRRRLCSR